MTDSLDTLSAATERAASPANIPWYRSPLPAGEFKRLHRRSDLLGLLQSGGFLAVIVGLGVAAYFSAGRLPVWATVLLVFLYGMAVAFCNNAVHELSHGTVFETKWLNEFFLRIFAFLGWLNFEWFRVSHARHHRYTLHQPHDLEVVLPLKVMLLDLLRDGVIGFGRAHKLLRITICTAQGRLLTEWDRILYPESDPKLRLSVAWARTMLIGHAAIIVLAVVFHLWMLIVLVTLGGFYGGWLERLCNHTQHIGLQDDVSDFRLCCRTFTTNPVLQFFYWHMNFHIEHHMYAAVPCYRLGRLHRLIRHDLPPCSHGLAATWREIFAIQKIQRTNPDYQHVAILPSRAA